MGVTDKSFFKEITAETDAAELFDGALKV